MVHTLVSFTSTLDYIGQTMLKHIFRHVRTVNALIRLHICAVWSGHSLSTNRIFGHYRMYEWRAKAQMILCACAGWSKSVHFMHVQGRFFASRGLLDVVCNTCIYKTLLMSTHNFFSWRNKKKCRSTTNEYPQHMFLWQKKKNIWYPLLSRPMNDLWTISNFLVKNILKYMGHNVKNICTQWRL